MAKVKNTDLVKYFQKAVKEGWGYVWSLNGEMYTQALADKYKRIGRDTSDWRDPATYWTEDCGRWIGRMAADCSGGIVGAMRSVLGKYSDRNADKFMSQAVQSGSIDTIPEVPGLLLWRKGHVGIYEGNGYALEFRGTEYGAVRTKLKERNFTHWGKLKDVEYSDAVAKPEADAWVVKRLLKLVTSPMQTGSDVKELQTRLNAAGFNCGKVDGILGPKTDLAIRKYQKAKGLTVDGKAGKKTITALGGVWRG